jgi:hypothetical protein
MAILGWSRRNDNNYEVSTKGDKRFSALNARLKDGRTIEEAYQLDVKGYRAQSNNWKAGKGKPPLNPMTPDQTWEAYLDLWRQWANENPELIADLTTKADGKYLTDCFASTPISQARALYTLLSSRTMKVLNIRVVSLSDELHYIGRPNAKTNWKGSALGNPFVMGKDGTRQECCAKYRKWLWEKLNSYQPGAVLSPELAELVQLCINKPNLVCWCAPQACHGDVLCKAIAWLTEGEGKKHSFYVNEVAPHLPLP